MNVENTQQVRQTGAAIESFRNQMVKDNKLMLENSNSKKIK